MNIFKKIFSIKNNKNDFFPAITEENFNSSLYWEDRYKRKGNSGSGSYGRLAEFKAEIINNFVKNHEIDRVIEFGCGDGNQLQLFNFKHYLGLDVSQSILDICINKFKDNSNYSFKNLSDYSNEKAELAMSLDVIFHLVEDDIFEQYMSRLFNASDKYIIIYSSNKDENHSFHVKHRKFSSWIESNAKDWLLLKNIPNKYIFEENNPDETSFSDFYIYKKKNIL